MKRLLMTASIAALLMSSAAFAAPGNGNDKQHDRDHDRYAYQQHGNNPKANGRHDNGLHLGQRKQAWKRGERIPQTYLADRYYINDYRAYRLDAPPRGYRWVRPYQDSNQYLLVQVATGLISQILGN